MRLDIRRLLIRVGFIFIVLLVVVFAANFTVFAKSKVKVVIKTPVDIAATFVFIDDKPVVVQGTGEYYYQKDVRRGEHTVRVVSAGFDDFTKKITVKPKETVVVEVALNIKKDLSANEQAESVYNDDTSSVTDGQYFGNNTWLVFYSSAPGLSDDRSIVVAKKNVQTGGWSVVDEGTDIDLNSSSYVGAPEDMLTYLRRQ